MIRFVPTLLAAAAMVAFVGQAQAVKVELNTEDFKVVEPSKKWMKKYGGPSATKAATLSESKLNKLQAKAAKKLQQWQNKQAANPRFVHTETGLRLNKSRGANFYMDTTELIDVKYTSSFSVDSDKANGAVGFVFGMTGQGTPDVSYYLLQWHNNKKKQGVELLKVDGVHNGNKKIHKNDLVKGGSKVTLLDSDDSVGGYGTDGEVNDVMITYLADSIEVMVGGTTLNASGDFEAGAFGYYAFGQSGVSWDPFPPTVENLGAMSDAEFIALIEEGTNPDTGGGTGASIPTPAALPAGLAMLMLAATRRKRRID